MDESARLMLAFRDGDDTAFDALFQRWAGPLLRYLERMVSDAGTAEELVQEAFLRVHGARDRYSHDARFSTWLYRIATNLALNELRRPRRKAWHQSTFDDAGAPVDLRDDAPAVDDVVDARRAGAALEARLGALPERQRIALWLTAVEGFSYAEVAGTLDTTEKSVKALVHRARSALASPSRPAAEAGPGAEGRERR
jgi:RNA polymerase sigma-70 factor (ECF subfamily)